MKATFKATAAAVAVAAVGLFVTIGQRPAAALAEPAAAADGGGFCAGLHLDDRRAGGAHIP